MNIAIQRLVNQRLIDKPFETAGEAVGWFGAVQSQDYPNAKWGVAQRMRAATDATLDHAFNAGEIVRVHAMRPTWHFIAARDLPWIQQLTGPRVHVANGYVYRNYELDKAILKKSRAVITKALAGGNQLTRAELGKLLEKNRIVVSGIRLAYIVMHAELDGIVCSGPLRGKQHTYMLVDERIRGATMLRGDAASAELARRYFRSHGPATAQDFAWWSGFTGTQAKQATALIEDELVVETWEGRSFYFYDDIQARFRKPMVHLLPNYDEHVVAYRNHNPSLDPRTPNALRNWGNALTAHLVVLDGLVIGGWRKTVKANRADINFILPIPMQTNERKALEAAIKRYAAFVGMETEISGVVATA